MFTLILLFAYFVSFADKPADASPALSERALAQREKWNIETDELDLPVSPLYMDSLRHMGVEIYHSSRWFNGVTCEMTEELAAQVEALDFVTEVEMTRDESAPIYVFARGHAKRQQEQLRAPVLSISKTALQLALYNLTPLHQAGFHGQGILMSICDGGFHNANTLSCFRHDLELGHFDFTDDTDGFYGYTGDHGTECLSTISGITDGYMGAATEAQYYLMRSEEYETESPKEMDNLVAALEASDSLGVNVFSVSLGYAYFDNDSWTLPKSALDGKSTRCSRAATIAARKGMLVCVAAGNEGNKSWHTISAPADADSILAVGAVDVNRNIADFSSYGPSADGRIKPEVCAVGYQTALIHPYGTIFNGNGTSFATPLLAGLAATLWSALPDENAMQIRERIIQSADRYEDPDTEQYGYGIPDAWKAYTMMPTGMESIQHSDVSIQKIMRNGQIYIQRGDKIYSITGQVVE